jgi:nucleoid DNA-binding protein
MSEPKFTRSRIQEILMSGAGLDLRRARELTGRIIGAVATGETVKLRSLGTLGIQKHSERRAHKPRTGEEVIVSAATPAFYCNFLLDDTGFEPVTSTV